MVRNFHWYDYITLNIYWLGLTTIAQTMTPLIVPLFVQRFVGDEVKGSSYGTLRLWTLMTALLVQALMGLLSDRSNISWGRRRPYILGGSIISLVLILATGLSANLSGPQGYWTLFSILIILSIATNTSQAGLQGLITDIVPAKLRGRFSGVKAFFEIPLPMVIVALVIAPLVAGQQFWLSLVVSAMIVLFTLSISMFTREYAPVKWTGNVDWRPVLRLAFMTAFFMGAIIAAGWFVRSVAFYARELPSPGLYYLITITTGLAGMAVPILVGVWASIRIGLGADVQVEPSFIWWVINRLAFLAGATNLGSFAIYYLQDRLGLLREQAAGPAGRLLMIVGIFIMITALPAGRLADRYGSKLLVTAAGLLAALGTIVVLSSATLWIIYLGGAVVGAAAGLFFSANWAQGINLVPREHAGRFLGVANLAGAGAGAIGAYIGGPLADYAARYAGPASIQGYFVLFIIFGFLFLFSALANQFITAGAFRSVRISPQETQDQHLSHPETEV